MFLHVVLMQFNGDADARFRERVQHYCARIRSECDGVAGYDFQPNVASRSDGLAYAVIGAFTDSAAHDRYQISPAHQEMKAYMAGFIERLVVCDSVITAFS